MTKKKTSVAKAKKEQKNSGNQEANVVDFQAVQEENKVLKDFINLQDKTYYRRALLAQLKEISENIKDLSLSDDEDSEEEEDTDDEEDDEDEE